MSKFLATLVLLLTLITPPAAGAQEKSVSLSVPPELQDLGLWRHVLPRFSLKTGIRVTLDPEGALRLAPEEPGAAVLSGNGITYRLSPTEDPYATRFSDWLVSDIGRRTIDSYSPKPGELVLSATDPEAQAALVVRLDGDARLGETLSLTHCGRCHVVSAANRLNGVGSTPSFALMRTFPDWQSRFESFYALNPHQSFTQIEDVTPPFEAHLPPAISPLELTLDQLDAILAFVGGIAPANLGAPILHQ